jgi:SAM-dependent methyltransferase
MRLPGTSVSALLAGRLLLVGDDPAGSEGFFGERVAAVYDERSAGMFDPAVVGPAVDLLAELAGDGATLEFAIGTGRIALPLAERGVRVAGIDNSQAMLARLRDKPGAERIDAMVGDMAATRVDGEFSLVYLVFNTIFNLVTQDGQVACFENAAAHLRSGGRFVIEARVPELQRLPLGQTVLPWRADPGGISAYVYDVVTQRLSGQHYHFVDGRVQTSPTEMRYAWPAELDLMARLAGMRLEDRWAGWRREPFTALSPSHVSVYEKT